MTDIEEIRRYYEAILPFYDESLADRGDLAFWEAMATRWASSRILELGCGTGRVTAVLVRHARVTAVDLLIEMLARAGRKAPAAHLVAADLRQFAFAGRFDLIVLADDPMAHLISMDDRARVLRLIGDHLTRDGRVVIEGLYRRETGAFQHQRGNLLVEETWTATDDPSVWSARYHYTKGASSVDANSLMRSWSLEEVADLPLRVESVWGDFDGRAFCDDSRRMIISAKPWRDTGSRGDAGDAGDAEGHPRRSR
jgi:SAM-dependent methyltransferase